MASSQIEIASASPPFGCILPDQNQPDRFRESENGRRLAFHNNIKEFLNTCSSSSTTTSISISNKNSTMTPSGLRKIEARWSPCLEMELEQPGFARSAGNSPNTGGASSLVQMWEARLNRSHSFNQNTLNCNSSSSSSSSRTNSGMSNAESASSESKKPDIEMDRQSSHMAAVEAEEEESQLNVSEPASQSERVVRVADIIKRLTSDQGSSSHNNDQEQSRESSPETITPRIKERLDQQQSSPRVANFPQISNMPRLRGRQAIQDLLMQMERDRQSEIRSLVDRKAVTKFAQKGRIQSMLRLKVLQRGLMQPQDHLPTRPKAISSSIATRRSRFDPDAESQAASKPSEDESSSRGLDKQCAPANEVPKSTLSSNQHENTQNGQQEAVSPNNGHKQVAAKEACEAVSCSSTSASKQPLGDSSRSLRRETTVVSTAIIEEQQQQRDSDASEYTHEISFVTLQDTHFDANEGGSGSISCWDGNGSITSADDDNNSQQHYVEENGYYDWFSDISRPRRYWEDRRQAWYQEVLETTSEDAEIRQLLERKTVSNFLDSSFRLRMDQLMMTLTRMSHQARPADEEDRTDQVMMRFFFRGQSDNNQQEQEEETHNEDGENEQIMDLEDQDRNVSPESDCNEVSSYFEQNQESPQLPLPSPMSSSTWSSFREPELSEDSYQTGSNQQQRSPFHYASNIRRTPTPSTNATSLEMELIYDLKGHMEQLYQEMTELRKSIRCCMDMQAKLQLSFKQEEVDIGKPAGNGTGAVTTYKKGSCCICYEKPVDSLLYRCGHMCTCLKCAQELQWSSGRCPICRAPIMDVVRAYTDS